MTNSEITFNAEFVEALSDNDNPDFIVHGIYFGEGDPEQGGEHWSFTRVLENDDDGVCTVKEIQQVTIYRGIDKFLLGRTHLICEFDKAHSVETGTEKLVITYDIPDDEWEKLTNVAKLVFSGENYFEIE